MALRFHFAGLTLLAAFATAGLVAHAQSGATAARPVWASEPLLPTNHARVVRVDPGAADVVMLDSGLYHGLRTGMKCLVERDGNLVAEIIIVASEPEKAAALIIAGKQDIHTGDSVRIELLRTA